MNRVPGDSQFHTSNSQDSPRFTEPYNLFQFYSNSDGPWIPQGVIQPAETLNSSSRSSAYNSGARSFHDYRSTGLPSECGTAPDDSGYGGSRSTYSFAESVAENDRCAENAYLDTTAEQLISDLNINTAVPMYPPSQMQHHQASPVEFRCNHCGASCKTKSELKKHSARHIKPYKCTYETCSKAKQGFSTPNDLARHKKTVHREHNDNDPIYICHHGNCSQKKKKLWPRADNFRSHLSRSHDINLKADSDLREYRYKPDTAKPLGSQDKPRSTPHINPGHGPMQLQDAPLVYTCPHHPCPQTKGKKTWPRADDFRAHLSHDHNLQLDDDLRGYHFQLEAAEAHALRGVGSSVADVDPEPRPAQLQDSPDLRGDQVSTTASGQVQSESSKQNNLPLTQTCLTSGDRPPPLRPSVLDVLMPSVPSSETLASHHIGDLTCGDEGSLGESEAMLPRDEVISESFDHEGDDIIEDEELDRQEPLMLQIASSAASVQLKADSPQEDISESLIAIQGHRQVLEASPEAPADTPTFESCKVSDLFPLLKNAATGDILSLLRNIPKDLLEKALKPEDQSASGNDDSSDPGEHQKAEIICSECGKAFSRNCELRKHLKRHRKPYGCTYKTCGKMFGSKNDWKRHESSQHFQLESWNCNFEDCDKVLPRRELFKLHLINHHKVQDSQEIEKRQDDCRLGRHCDPRFWCGFCDKFVEIEGEVVNSWTKRCDHIDSHLFGKDGLPKKEMREWRYLEDKLAEGEPERKLAEGSSGPSKKRKATEDMSSRPSKRTNISWSCCRCGHLETYHTSSSCQEGTCQHQRCGNCRVEATEVPDDDDTEMVNMN
ncbi:hypothetical protein GGI35DRAFT_162364 [Trichoderma velutinum]